MDLVASTSEQEVKPCNRPIEIKRALLIYPFNRISYSLESVLNNKQNIEAPLGLAYIVGFAKKYVKDLHIEIFDANAWAIKHIRETKRADMDEIWSLLKEKIADYDPDIVGVSCLFFTTSKNAHRICETVKSVSSKIVTTMGGNYPTALSNIALADDNLDFILESEGEKSFASLVEGLRAGFEPSDVVDGVIYKPDAMARIGADKLDDTEISQNELLTDESETVHNPKVIYSTLDDYPWPDRSSLDVEFYATNMRHFVNRVEDSADVRLASMTASRGCPFECTFCASKDFWGKQIRYRDPKQVVDEMKFLIDTYNLNTFVFNDDNLVFNAKNVIALCNEIKRQNLDIRWFVSGGLQVSGFKNPDVIDAVVETGLRQFNLAIETGDADDLKRIKKPLKAGMTEEVIANIRKHEGVWIMGFFITGFWFDTLENIEKRLQYAGSLDLDWRGIYVFSPIPGTEDYKTCLERGYINDLRVEESQFDEEMISISTENFTHEQVLNINYGANLEYNFFKNRNLKINPVQAIREFNYILEVYNDHAMAYYARGLAQRNLGQRDLALESFGKARDLVNKSKELKSDRFTFNIQILDADVRWCDYFDKFGIDVEADADPRNYPQSV